MEYAEIIVGFLATILALFVANKWKELNRLAKSTFIVGLIAASLFSVNEVRKIRKEKLVERIESTYGDIEDDGVAKIKTIEIGYGGTQFTFDLPDGDIFIVQGKPIIGLFIKNKKLLINAVCRDESGKVVAAIEKNEWTIYDKKYEYNNDDNAFELVVKGEKRAIFQVDLLKGIAHVAGLFINENSNGWYFSEGPQGTGGMMMIVKGGKSDYPFTPISPIFKYPRERYLGIRLVK